MVRKTHSLPIVCKCFVWVKSGLEGQLECSAFPTFHVTVANHLVKSPCQAPRGAHTPSHCFVITDLRVPTAFFSRGGAIAPFRSLPTCYHTTCSTTPASLFERRRRISYQVPVCINMVRGSNPIVCGRKLSNFAVDREKISRVHNFRPHR